MSDLSPERVFSLHPKIRWAGLATDQGEVIFAQMRPGIKSYSPEDTDRSFMQLGPMLMTGVCERLAPWAGPLETVASTYEKVILIVTKLGAKYLAMTLDRKDADVVQDLFPKLVKLASQQA